VSALSSLVTAFVAVVAGALLAVSPASAGYVTTVAGGPQAVSAATLAAPTGLTATATCTIGIPNATVRINLSWTQTSSVFADGYEILRAVGAGTRTTLATLSGRGTTTYTDSAVAYSTQYSYEVKAKKINWRSPPSSPASATTKSSLCL
jgi:hypothetical protein